MGEINLNNKRNVGIYIHVPFCLSKCHYCDFCSEQRANDEKKELYVTRLCNEIKLFSEKIGEQRDVPIADTVYFGGGTPTLLSAEQIDRVLNTIDRCFGIEDKAEITAETNPKSADENKLAEIRRAGVDRLSIGMQSIHDRELRALGRIHNSGDFLETLSSARRVGFDNISADLMYGIPNQTRESFKKSVEGLAILAPEHISSYSLTVEEGTNFYRRRDSLAFPDEDTVSDMYADMNEILQNYGYHRYEVSNFSKDGRESRHNLKYWRCDDYLGFGPAAHSCFDGKRFAHSRDINAYLRGESIIIDVEELSQKTHMNEYAMLGMRLASGVDFEAFKQRFGRDFMSEFSLFAKYSPEFVEIGDNFCKFTEKGIFVSNFILSDVLDFSEE